MPQNNQTPRRVLRRREVGAVSDDLVIERPRTAAAALGISLATFWRKLKDEPGFPQLVRLGPNSVGIVRAERLDYTRRLIAERDAGQHRAA
jgi:predicted DNA-binding transcriptional regulator AlpA